VPIIEYASDGALGILQLFDLRADCRICNCDRICRTCHDNIDHLYDYDDDEWIFDDDSLGLDNGDDDFTTIQTVPAPQPLGDDNGITMFSGQVEVQVDDVLGQTPPGPVTGSQIVDGNNDDDSTETHGTSPVPNEFNIDTRGDDLQTDDGDGDDDNDSFMPGQPQQLVPINGGNGIAKPKPPPPVLNIIDVDGTDFNFEEDDNTVDDNLLDDEDRR
jgi:hypothetical protein